MLAFRNGYNQPVWVFVAWYSPGCKDGSNWEKEGWWNMGTNQTVNVLDFDLREVNRYYLFYAESSDGVTWTGPYFTQAPQEAFDWCYNTGSTDSRTLGMRELDIGDNDNYTVTLIR
jgi:uncharacterized membrane protein